MNKIFCPECNEKTTYHIINQIINEYKEYKVDVIQHIAVCDKCSEKIYVSELENENLKRLYKKYRNIAGIISPKEIINFREKYSISQRELVAILDWGKMTINRYERGSLPNQIHSNTLELIIRDERYFKEKIEEAYKNNRINEKTHLKLQNYLSSKI
ncbi:type II TA system antitoxin MqsA family protein [Paraclostridium tenue]|uniref:HTH cro/C1-type domain-containing protein n=1 Tax=Paraclostridium tenue TaxID=1737 RepID=A0ABN1M609_9FIRM